MSLPPLVAWAETSHMPPLPESAGKLQIASDDKDSERFAHMYYATQMREYGALCRRMALEQALKICQDRINYGEVGALLCRDRIRELLK